MYHINVSQLNLLAITAKKLYQTIGLPVKTYQTDTDSHILSLNYRKRNLVIYSEFHAGEASVAFSVLFINSIIIFNLIVLGLYLAKY